jgi:thiol-disulfide isomerase/thioredoxin
MTMMPGIFAASRSTVSDPRLRLRLLLAVVGFAGIAGMLMFRGPVAPGLEGAPRGFVVGDVPSPVPDLRFADGEEWPLSLADFHGKVVLLNVWATWCLPCRKEMPTLDRLQAALSGQNFEVVALSIDRQGTETVRTFYSEIGIKHLALYVDASGQALSALAALGLPTTILIDGEGRELGRLVGPAEWAAPEMVAFLKSIIEPKGQQMTVPDKEDSQ